MRLSRKLILTAALISSAALTPIASACFSIIVGKKASATGEIILAHNEDNDRRIVMAQYSVPRMTHAPGTMLTFENGAAKIPQVQETWAYYWTQTISPYGYSFSDGFINEWGVAVVTDNCLMSNEKTPEIKDGGVGYGVRRIIAERARTAREAVDIAIDLLNKYGYRHPGRSYQIADANEAWMLQIVRGNRYVAKRIADNEVALIANAYTIRQIDIHDKENVITSPDLIEYAIKNGWYTPAKAGDYSDFDFAAAYQPDDARLRPMNVQRHHAALKVMTGKDYTDPIHYPFSIIPTTPVTIDLVKATLRVSSDETIKTQGNGDAYHTSMNDVSNLDTQESVIIEMRKNPDLIVAWRATGRPDTSPYIPWYPAAGVPPGQNWADPATGQTKQFGAKPADFDYKPERALWTFIKTQNFLNFDYNNAKTAQDSIKKIEGIWASQQATIEAKAGALLSQKRELGLNYLYLYSVEQTQLAQYEFNKLLRQFDQHHFVIRNQNISLSKDSTVETILYGSKDLDVQTLDRNKTYLGVAYSDGDSMINASPAKPVDVRIEDVNKDGLNDAILVFNGKEVAWECEPGIYTDLYLRTFAGNKRIVASDAALITE